MINQSTLVRSAFLPVCLCVVTTGVYADTHTAATCSQTDVKNAVTTASYEDTVLVPSGTSTWTSGIEFIKDIKIIGAGIDKTILTLNFADNSIYEAFFKFVPDATSRSNLDSLSDTHTFEVSGITFAGNNRRSLKFAVWIDNYSTPSVRRVNIHDCKFTNIHRAVQVKGYVHGVFHSNILINSNASYPQGAGYASFANDRMRPGLGDGWYIEDNTFSFTPGSDGAVCGAGNDGGGYIVRYNTVTGQMLAGQTYLETHGNQLSGIFGPQITEVYGNNMTATGIGQSTVARGGKNLYLFNIFADPDIEIREEYSDAQTSTTNPVGKCIEPGQGIGRQRCTDECICQKVHDSYFLNNRLSTPTGAIINPYIGADWEYDWVTANDPPEIVENSEFFSHKTSFDGTSGVGCGTLANRPTTCTVGVGYWATNQSCTDLTGMVGARPPIPLSGTLYKCTASNIWTAWYTPYTYPHALRSGSLTSVASFPGSKELSFDLRMTQLYGSALYAIFYTLPSSTPVDLAIYDMSGKKVRTAVSGQKAGGTYTTYFDTKGMSAGVLVCRLETRCGTAAKMLLTVH